jgi:hypothetical protein
MHLSDGESHSDDLTFERFATSAEKPTEEAGITWDIVRVACGVYYDFISESTRASGCSRKQTQNEQVPFWETRMKAVNVRMK